MAVYDATNPEARKYYWHLMDKALFNIGVDAWWLDTDRAGDRRPGRKYSAATISWRSAAAIVTSTCIRS